MTPRTVLVSGASIAGPALAYWLHHHGMTPIVVERAPGLRPGGQTVDVRGAGRTVVQRMGLEDAVRAATTGEDGIAFVDADDRVRARFGADAFDGEGFVAELEVLRGELSAVLYERTREFTEYVFDDRITGLTETADGVHVTFRNGPDRDVDLVVAADGPRSRTRDLVLADATTTKPLNLQTAYFTIPRSETDGTWFRWYGAARGRTVALRPDNLGTTRALLSFLSEPRGYEDLAPEAQKDLLARTFADAGWESPRVLEAMRASDDFYFESISQIRMDTWSRGRVTVVGDAGYCASPISGMGTSLALVGAYVLAGELATHDDHREAFASYERVLRPYVDRAQKLPPGAPRIANPRTALGVRTFNAVMALAASGPARWVAGRFASPPAQDIELPTYPVARV